ncbi:MAG: divalent-cation tolerance protein CutA [Candidatus Aenigmatarchaeota archaeon]
MSFAFVYVTCSNKKEANKIALHLLDKKLIACANIFPIESLYWWKEKIEKAKEFILIVKTSNKKFKKVENEIKKIHSYSIPCIIRFDAKANKKYEKWIKTI